jgi:uncharacterized surface protein with fasciclin (FAS1) repeats
MRDRKLKSKNSQKWFAKLTSFGGIAVVGFLLSIPVLASYYPRYALFQPYAYSNYPYRDSKTPIADTLEKEPKYASLVEELKIAGLYEQLKQPGKFTLFAPTNDAFDALSSEVFDLLKQPENQKKVLKYHLVAGEVAAKDVDRGSVVTVEGKPIKINIDAQNAVKLNNDTNAMHPSTKASNGVIIEVDRVLLPPDF